MAPVNDYGIAGSTSKQSTSPTASAPPPTTTWWQRTVRTRPTTATLPWASAWNTNFANQAQQESEFYRRGQAAPAFRNMGTPMRPVPVSPGTAMRPVPEPPTPRELPYFGGTPTNTAGYRSYDEYFGGTPTGTYDPNARPTSPSELETIKKTEDTRKRREQEAADAAAAEDARLARLREIYSTLGVLTPEQQQAYRQAVRNAEREFEMMRNQIQLGRRTARRDFRQGVREVNRQQSGGSQDLATALAYLGMDTSPATMGVGLQDIERQSDLARAELARVRAITMGGLDAQMTDARIGRNRQLSAAEQNRLAAQAQRATDLERYRMGLFE